MEREAEIIPADNGRESMREVLRGDPLVLYDKVHARGGVGRVIGGELLLEPRVGILDD